MSTIQLTSHQWQKIYEYLCAHPNVYAGNQEACQRFVEGVHWVLRSGAQWRELPEQYGNWNSVSGALGARFTRWEEQGIWAAMHEHFAQDADMENGMLDSTVIRAHMCAAGG